MYLIAVCVCLFVWLPLQIYVLTVTCVYPALSSVTYSVSRAAAPCGPSERCTTARQTDFLEIPKHDNTDMLTPVCTSTLFTLHLM